MPKLNIADLLSCDNKNKQIKNISNIVEILVAMIFFHYSEKDTEHFILMLYSPYVNHELEIGGHEIKQKIKKYKTLLQELIQLDIKSKIQYIKKVVNFAKETEYHITLVAIYYGRAFKIETTGHASYKISQELAAYILYNMIKANYVMNSVDQNTCSLESLFHIN